ncbi:L-seryl-tRNA(Sec) selenium transferase [Lignipirellula cremea]|uniref:L-seryl-tRNA(Sec) selenium transferase n=1 Tax=Lignipirellula cremea TaxID=2528010 RepID=A0A518DU18_9BACT|nr:L-seryl-tRNA(Sec) selenium transferase [Lignipirellula cremea]QDU95319.1 L-seryl-tRNA(Sec) selenium transferase [Lignipirellula cremea]
MQNPLRNLPSVNDLMDRPALRDMLDTVSRSVVVSGVRSFLDNLRQDIRTAAVDFKPPTPGELAERIAEWISREETPKLRPVVNGTGVLLHTGLGRAPLAEEAIAAMGEIARGYATLEVDAVTGERSQRIGAVESLLCELTGAEAAAVVNNNAAATMLTLTALAHGREVIVSRGQLIEIGGSYRLPEVMTTAGAQLREVGATNKTRIDDYRNALCQETAALLRVHPSNYVVVGFASQPTLEELVSLGRSRRIPVIDDIGSGALIDLSRYGLHDEPIARDSISQGADLVLFSGDKLLGGPQCGVIVGRKEWVDKLVRHPLMRAIRVDKTTLAALGATLEMYRDAGKTAQRVPLLMLLDTPLENLKHRAERLAPQIAATSGVASAVAVETSACLGGGSLPTQQIPSWAIAVRPQSMSVDQLAASLRNGLPSLFGRVHKDQLLIDLKAVFPYQDMQIAAAFETLGGKPKASTAASGELLASTGESAMEPSTGDAPSPDAAPPAEDTAE